MNHDDLVDNLGTIARSGTAEFVSHLGGDIKNDVSLIGQFGVGFYSAFMVSERVVVHSHKAGEDGGWVWESEGEGEFTVAESASHPRGAAITLTLREDAKDFLEADTLRRIVKRYSDHIAIPVVLIEEDGKEEELNSASALWTRSKSEVTPEQYKEFYHHVAHAFDDPWLTLHYKAEGAIEYTGLLYIPSQKPFDIFHPDRKQHVKLYVNRVFITDQVEDMLPPYLRFLRGVVDSHDLPLNVSRELLQHNPMLAKIKAGLVKRVLSELKKKTENAEDYATFWETFGAVLKEGLYEDFDRRADILPLCRFRSTAVDGWTTLDEVVTRMKEGQDAIHYITGDDVAGLKRSPQLEGFLAKGVEVLLLTDPIDEFWMPAIGDCQGKPFRAVTDASVDLSKIKAAEGETAPEQPPAASEGDMDLLVAALKQVLGEAVRDVRPSERLTGSPVCLVTDAGQMSIHMEKMLRAHRQIEQEFTRVLEINPRHPLIKGLADQVKAQGAAADINDVAHLLLDQARIIEGDPPADPTLFAQRMGAVIAKGMGV